MRILAVDIGTGTQDILLFDSSTLLENCVQMIMPSPTVIVAQRVKKATEKHQPIFLKGVTMGGGPNQRALIHHIASGLSVYATEEAALTFGDDLESVENMGLKILARGEVPHMPDLETIELKDLDLAAIRSTLEAFAVNTHFDVLAVAVLDHGFAPGMSNRLFRFEHLRRILSKNRDFTAFSYIAQNVPEYLTRMLAVVKSIDVEVPVLLSDTGIAAVMGALQDEEVARHDHLLAVNVGNGHTIAFHLRHGLIEGLFEHHTGLLDVDSFDLLLGRLSRGTLTNQEVYDKGGHGALVFNGDWDTPFITVTGPRQDVIADSGLKPYRAVPHGDNMLAGCYGLVKACAMKIDAFHEEIEEALMRKG